MKILYQARGYTESTLYDILFSAVRDNDAFESRSVGGVTCKIESYSDDCVMITVLKEDDSLAAVARSDIYDTQFLTLINEYAIIKYKLSKRYLTETPGDYIMSKVYSLNVGERVGVVQIIDVNRSPLLQGIYEVVKCDSNVVDLVRVSDGNKRSFSNRNGKDVGLSKYNNMIGIISIEKYNALQDAKKIVSQCISEVLSVVL